MSKIPTTNEMIETVNGLAIQNAIFIVFLFFVELSTNRSRLVYLDGPCNIK